MHCEVVTTVASPTPQASLYLQAQAAHCAIAEHSPIKRSARGRSGLHVVTRHVQPSPASHRVARSCCWCESTIPREATTTLYFPQQFAATFRHRENGLRKLRLVFPSLSFGFHCRQSKTLSELTLGSWLHQSARVESCS